MNRFLLFTFLFSLFYANASFSQNYKGINFQGIIQDPDGGYPTAMGLSVTLQILDPVSDCVLREEVHSGVNVSNGYLNLVIGASSATVPAESNPNPILTMQQLMDNSQSSINGFNCSYIPSQGHGRKLRLKASLPRSSGGNDLVIADFNMRSVAFAVNSETLDGKTKDQFIQTSASVTQEALNSFMATLKGSSGHSVKWNGSSFVSYDPNSGTNLTNVPFSALTSVPAPLTQIGGLTCTDGKILKIVSGAWQCATESSGGGGTLTALTGDVTASGSGSVAATVKALQNKNVSATSPSASTSGQVLRWNHSSNQWEPSFVSMFDLRSTVTGTNSFAGAGCLPKQTLTWTSATDTLKCEDISITKSQVSDFPTLAASATTDTTNAGNITSGTLDQNRLPASITNALWQESSGNIYRNTGFVGIGTSTPTAPLEVKVSTLGSHLAFSSPQGNPGIVLQLGDGAGNRLNNWVTGIATSDQSYYIQERGASGTTGSKHFVISSGGKMGVGSQTPLRGLHVENASGGMGVFKADTDGAHLSGAILGRTDYGFEADGLRQSVARIAAIAESDISTSGGVNNNVTGGLGFFTLPLTSNLTEDAATPIERVRITRTGNIGVGTSSPMALMHLKGGRFQSDSEVSDPGIEIKAFGPGRNPVIVSTATRGTSAAPTATATSDDLFRIVVHGHNGTSAIRTGEIKFTAAENFTTSAGGTNLTFANANIGAASATEKMRLDSEGRLAIGTTYPEGKVKIRKDSSTPGNIILALQNRDVTTAPDALIAFSTGAYDFSDNRYPYFGAVAEAGQNGHSLVFAPNPNSSSAVERMRITPAGFVGIGTTNPAVKLVVADADGVGAPYSSSSDKLAVIGNGNAVIQVTAPNTASSAIYFSDPDDRDPGGISYSHATNTMSFRVNDGFKVFIDPNGNVGIGNSTPDEKFVVSNGTTVGKYTTGGWTHVSDARLKEDIKPLHSSLEKILRLKPVVYKYKNDTAHSQQVGFIAQDVEKEFPEVVVTGKDGFKSMIYANLVSPVVGAIKELYADLVTQKMQLKVQQQQVASLDNKKADRSEVEQLRKENTVLKEKIDQLETMKEYLCTKDPQASFCKN